MQPQDDDAWLKNMGVMLQLGQTLCFGDDPHSEFIVNMQCALPLLKDADVPRQVQLRESGVFAQKGIPKHAFVTAYPGDVVHCDTKHDDVQVCLSQRCRELSNPTNDDVPRFRINDKISVQGSNNALVVQDPCYVAHMIRQATSPQEVNCVARMLQCGVQVLFFATRDIAEDEELRFDWTAKPIQAQVLCFTCLSRERAVRLCSRCKLAAYCSKECQKTHWPQHKHMCAT